MAVKWVAIDALGGQSGATRTLAWTWPEAIANCAAGDLIWVVHHSLNRDGSPSGASYYPLTATSILSNYGTAANAIRFVGLDASDNPIQCSTFGNGPVLDWSGGGTNGIQIQSRDYYVFWGLTLQNTTNTGIWDLADHNYVVLCDFVGMGNAGIVHKSGTSVSARVIFCRAHDSLQGFRMRGGGIAYGCVVYNVTSIAFSTESSGGGSLFHCYIRVEEGGGINAFTVSENGCVVNGTGVSTATTDATVGITCGATNNALLVGNTLSGFLNQAINGPTYTPQAELANNFHNNVSDRNYTPVLAVNDMAVNPAFPDISNNDFSPIAVALRNILGIGQDLDIGAAQGSGGSGGYRPRLQQHGG